MVKDEKDETWYLLDDDLVSIADVKKVVFGSPHMLVYERVSELEAKQEKVLVPEKPDSAPEKPDSAPKQMGVIVSRKNHDVQEKLKNAFSLIDAGT
jgi:hypothetical protein